MPVADYMKKDPSFNGKLAVAGSAGAAEQNCRLIATNRRI